MAKAVNTHSTAFASSGGRNPTNMAAGKSAGYARGGEALRTYIPVVTEILGSMHRDFSSVAQHLSNGAASKIRGLPLVCGTDVAVVVHEGKVDLHYEPMADGERDAMQSIASAYWQNFLETADVIAEHPGEVVILAGRWASMSNPGHFGGLMLYAAFRLEGNKIVGSSFDGDCWPLAAMMYVNSTVLSLTGHGEAGLLTCLQAATDEAVTKASADHNGWDGTSLVEGMVWYLADTAELPAPLIFRMVATKDRAPKLVKAVRLCKLGS